LIAVYGGLVSQFILGGEVRGLFSVGPIASGRGVSKREWGRKRLLEVNMRRVGVSARQDSAS